MLEVGLSFLGPPAPLLWSLAGQGHVGRASESMFPEGTSLWNRPPPGFIILNADAGVLLRKRQLRALASGLHSLTSYLGPLLPAECASVSLPLGRDVPVSLYQLTFWLLVKTSVERLIGCEGRWRFRLTARGRGGKQ